MVSVASGRLSRSVRASSTPCTANVQSMRSDARRKRWEQHTETPLIVAAVAFLGSYAWPILDPDLSDAAELKCKLASVAIWITFGADLAVRLALAEHRVAFLRGAWLDVITLAVPMLRPLRALRAVVALSILVRRGAGFARGRVVAAVSAAVAVVSFIAALAMLDAERANPDANIRSFGDAAWWAAATVPTVGYGDRYPTTTEGRFVAVGLMLTGIALLGVVTAAIASWFVERMTEVAEESAERTGEEVSDLAAEIRALRAEVASLRPAEPGAG